MIWPVSLPVLAMNSSASSPQVAVLANLPPTFTRTGAVATITLNRPAYHNRLHQDDLDTLLGYCQSIQADASIRVVILTAQVRDGQAVFSSGFHIGEFENSETPNGRVLFERVPDALAELDAVTIASLNGSVYGGASDLALACDFRLGVKGMQLRMSAGALGLHFYPSGLVRYVTRWGVAHAKKSFLTAHTWGDQELLDTHFLDELISAGQLHERTHDLALQVSALAPLAVKGMKRSLNEVAENRVDWQRLRDREALVNASADFVEGRRAYAQRRPAQFTGV